MVFSTLQLAPVREFYLSGLGLRIGTCEKDGRAVPDEDDRYVNFECEGVLLGFEKGDHAEKGTLVLKVDDLRGFLGVLAGRGVRPVRQRGEWAVVQDPEGREIILQE